MKKLLIPFVLGVALATGGVSAAAAQSTAEVLAPVVTRLEAEGYDVIESHRSWFGRLVVVSTRDGMLREVVLNRTTGAVLSDRLFAQPVSGNAAAQDAGADHGSDASSAGGSSADGNAANRSGSGNATTQNGGKATGH